MHRSSEDITKAPWAFSAHEVLAAFETDADRGLTSAVAVARLSQIGPNEIPEPEDDPLWKRYWGQLTGDTVVILLGVGGIASLLLGDFLEGGAIILMLNIMASFGLWQEGKANQAARALRNAETSTKLVIRDGRRQEISVALIVPGDIVYLPTGTLPPADGRLVAAVNAEKDDSALTGEPTKSASLEPVPVESPVNSQDNMVFRGCPIVSGNATMLVTATGPRTKIGEIAVRLAESEKERTPLDEQLDALGDQMARVFLVLAALVIGAGLARDLYRMNIVDGTIRLWPALLLVKEAFINAVALIIAAIPEGLPAVLTITLAIATQMMKKQNALVKRPKAVEGGGSMNVLCTDKTGTLTANRMSVEFVCLNARVVDSKHFASLRPLDEVSRRALRIASGCNNNSSVTEAALLHWVESSGFDSAGDIGIRAKEHPFSQSLKRMTTVHAGDSAGLYHILTKGSPEHLLELCHLIHIDGQDVPLSEQYKSAMNAAIKSLAAKGLRVVALADRSSSDGHVLSRDNAEQQLTFVGLLGIMDPPRDDVAPAVKTLEQAGIRTVMVTGDNPDTAFHIAKSVGIVDPSDEPETSVIVGEELSRHLPKFPTGIGPKEKEKILDDGVDNLPEKFLERLRRVEVFARVEPEHKDFIVRALQRAGQIVGFTGDGVNDALALRKSDVGFSMGNGTDVAREAGDVILTDSRFGTIPKAVEEGRNVIDRIRLYLSYILSGNGCEVGVFVAAYAMGFDIPLTALVLLVINFATDSFPALAMAFEPGESDVMSRPPRRRGVPFIDRTMWIHIGVQTVVATVVIMAVYWYFYPVAKPGVQQADLGLAMARSAAFMTYIFQKLYRAFTARSLTRGLFEIGVFRNPWTVGAVAISLSIALVSVYVPVVNDALRLAPLSLQNLGICALAGLLPPIAEELTKPFVRN